MTPVRIADCAGQWRRTLLIEADGSHVTDGDVRWLQGPSAYVDSRGFAGTLSQDGSVFSWHRSVDLTAPGPFPDAGEMRWEGDTLVETGVHEDYVEHWVRDAGTAVPCGALLLAGPDGAPGLLVRVGALFGFAGGGEVFLDDVGAPRWRALEIETSEVRADGVRWTIRRTEGNPPS